MIPTDAATIFPVQTRPSKANSASPNSQCVNKTRPKQIKKTELVAAATLEEKDSWRIVVNYN